MTPKSISKWFLIPFILLFILSEISAQTYNIDVPSIDGNTGITNLGTPDAPVDGIC